MKTWLRSDKQLGLHVPHITPEAKSHQKLIPLRRDRIRHGGCQPLQSLSVVHTTHSFGLPRVASSVKVGIGHGGDHRDQTGIRGCLSHLLAKSVGSCRSREHKVIVQALVGGFRQRRPQAPWNGYVCGNGGGFGIRSLAPLLGRGCLCDCVLARWNRSTCDCIRGCPSNSEDRMVCPHRTVGSVSSQRVLEKEQMARYLIFKVAAPATASAWTSIVQHCGQLARHRRIDYHKDDLGQPRLPI